MDRDNFGMICTAQTMEMMYRVIAQELKAMNIENAKLQDYLNFYCLGNRGEPSTNGSPDSDKSSDRSAAVVRILQLVWTTTSSTLLEPAARMEEDQRRSIGRPEVCMD
ncbi:phospholipase D alpha 1-like isoform X1 [Lolium rigidum]|uniref:phospholipase D alpha 1-like isoform X1 n=1 Tax=Lolium rigidum TaxID=89674 RepID=UPI001F5CE92B|nr:phospholipase D alpha 1-like isoform X1 [Lolium rigidum]XP_047059013.1 phospholipase D alpha 1-like isoform X1 [Lolium rigidum]